MTDPTPNAWTTGEPSDVLDAAGGRYTIISADSHCGLPAPEYRDYLDPAFHADFDEYLAQQQAARDEALTLNYDYIMGWETENEEGLRGGYDAAQRDKELDADGVAAEVMFADADAITGFASPPFGAGLGAGMIERPDLAFAGARALVCSPLEVARIRAAVGPQVLLVTPGVRPAGAAVGDQKRVATPAQAIADGSDLLVIGRPITGAADPGAASAAIAAEISSSSGNDGRISLPSHG